MNKIFLSLILVFSVGFLFSACSSKNTLQRNTPTVSPTSTEMSDQDLLKALESDSNTSVDASFNQIDQVLNSN